MSIAGWLLDVAAVVLVVAGAAKLVEPGYTTVALGAMGLPSSAAVVRVVAMGEAAFGALALTVRSAAPAALIAASYVAFSVVVVAALRRGIPVTSCGCLGRVETPPTLSHVVLTAVAAGGSVWAAVVVPEPLLDALGRRPGTALAFAVAVAIGAFVMLRLLAARPVVRARR